jgi:hypothetical protein
MSSETAGTKRDVHFVLSTHWDREWREPFQGLRFDLVQILDHVFEGLEAGRLRTPFSTDGQSSPIDDYLAIRPERREDVAELIRSGMVEIGPWYTLPDEFLVSGESLVRNLELGRKRARDYGAVPSRAGFVCDMFGHISQLPQIFAGFGIIAGFIWRGINLTGRRNVMWTGADGTRLPCHRFGPHGYCSYAISVRRGYDYEGAIADEHRLDEYLRVEQAATEIGPVLVIDTCDHQDWDEDAYAMMAKRMSEHPDFILRNSSLDRYAEILQEEAGKITYEVRGELREPGREPFRPDRMSTEGDEQWVIPGVASSRPYLKQGYVAAEAILLRWAEPFSLAAELLAGGSYAPGFLDLAWQMLIENQTHDSIGGCSIDQVHRDMEYRNDQARVIGEKLRTDALSRIAASAGDVIDEDELRLTLFNPSPQDAHQVVEVDIPVPTSWLSFSEFFGYEDKPGFRIYDANGEVHYQRLSQSGVQARPRVRRTRMLEKVTSNVVRIALAVDVPAVGYQTLVAKPTKPDHPFVRHPQNGGLVTSARSMSNGIIGVTIEGDGGVTIEDQRNGASYPGMLTFEDSADLGDGWYHGPAVNDEVVVSGGGRVDIRVISDGPLLARFWVATTLALPQRFDEAKHRRDDRTVGLTIETVLTLRSGMDHLECATYLVNTARDHRLRAIFPSGCQASTYLADSAFDAVRRPIGLRSDNYSFRELEVETKPQQSWTAVFDEDRGIAVVAPGLHETAVRMSQGQPIALTLLRSTGRTAFFFREPEGQMLNRPLEFRFAVVPLLAGIDPVAMARLADEVQTPVMGVVMDSADQAIFRHQGIVGKRRSFFRVEGDLLLVSARATGKDRVVLRLVNPGVTETRGVVSIGLGREIEQVIEADLEGVPKDGRQMAWEDGSFAVSLGTKEIKTVVVVLGAEK